MHKHTQMRALLLATMLTSSVSLAQTFPAEDTWRPLWCGLNFMFDPYRDESGASDERDLVGNQEAPAAFRMADTEFLYLRIRVDRNAKPNDSLRPFAWGVLVDTDGVFSTYEVMFFVNGVANTLSLYKNTSTTVANDPTDPPDEPAVRNYDPDTHVRSVEASDSTFGSNADFYLDFAVPWADLRSLGITPTTPIVSWVATSSSATTLNGDLACFDDAGGPGTLSGSGSGRTVFDPRVDSDGDGHTDAAELQAGTDPNNAASRPSGVGDANYLAGGGGCQTTAATWASACLALIIAAWFVRRRVRS
jgi:hypothetical protein